MINQERSELPKPLLPLSVMLLLLSAPKVWYLQGPLIAWCALGLAYQQNLRMSWFWYVAGTIMGATIYIHWSSSDNHKYLMLYLCLAYCCVFSLPVRQQSLALRVSARWLIGLCMAAAVYWKVINPEYRSGAFFEFVLLCDERFRHFAALVSSVDPADLATNHQLKQAFDQGPLFGLQWTSVQLLGVDSIRGLATWMTWWTVGIESLLAFLFLVPASNKREWTKWLPDVVLFTFAITTYSVATVRGFGWTLMLLGMAQADPQRRWISHLYLIGFIAVQLFTMPYLELFTRLTG